MSSSLQDYLQKNYLSGSGSVKKKKKVKLSRAVPLTQSKFKIIDENDSGWQPLEQDNQIAVDLPESDDERPTIAEFVDERPDGIVKTEAYRMSLNWKALGHGDDVLETSNSESVIYDNKIPDGQFSRRNRHDSSDSSPPRRLVSSNNSPSKRHDSSDDSSPRKRKLSIDASPPRKRQNSCDASPPRRRQNSSDASPPRRRQNSSDASPPRRRQNSSDASPPRRRQNSSDASPPRRRQNSSDASPPRSSKLDAASKSVSSANSKQLTKSEPIETVYRDRKTGMKKEVNKELVAKQKLLDQKVNSWKKGVLQNESKEKAVESAIHEMGKSFTRLKGDSDLEDMLRNTTRLEDPMAEYMKVQKAKKSKQPQLPKYSGPWPANRFNIPPGYRWDGVDRTNGFEKKYFESINSRQAVAEEAHKWSIEDM